MTRKHHTQEPVPTPETNETQFAAGEPGKHEEIPAPKGAGPDGEKDTDQLETEVAEMKDKYLRLYSEFDNYRKRTLKEKAELSKTASAGVITALLPVVDDLERAIKVFSESGQSITPEQEGVVLIYNKLMNTLSQQGLELLKSAGEPFDTDYMEAITMIDVNDPSMKGKVVDETLKGYKLNGTVIRFAKVVVGK